MPQTVLLGHPRYFRIVAGANPHTRDRWGRRRVVKRDRMLWQWERFRQTLVDLGVRVLVLPPSVDHPGAVFPANAGLRVGDTVYLSRPSPARAGERALFRPFLERHGYRVEELPPVPGGPGPPGTGHEEHPQWEGEADTFPVGDPSGDPARAVYLFTHGRLERPRWTPRWGWPPYRRVYGFRTDARALPAIQRVTAPREVMPLALMDERYYHGDTCLGAFGPRREWLLAYWPALAPEAQRRLTDRFGERIVPLTADDAAAFAANAFPVDTPRGPRLVIARQISAALAATIRARGVEPVFVDVSEFTVTGGGSVKCLLLNLGDS
ncbi:MAG: hypothetical protein HY600_00050 [Candidatus Omnitrophica bacterium]|nr:hypothetical protein [Candidatus Omnitrophota bacterium]